MHPGRHAHKQTLPKRRGRVAFWIPSVREDDKCDRPSQTRDIPARLQFRDDAVRQRLRLASAVSSVSSGLSGAS